MNIGRKILFSLVTIAAVMGVCFVLGVFLVSVLNTGYLWGIIASVASTVLVNYAFTYPFFKISFWPEPAPPCGQPPRGQAPGS